jgi:glycosyltransferase involved in cell wall biosynthesis
MSTHPSFTVLMPVYAGDTPDRFERSMNSLYAGAVKPDAVLLVVDGPVSVPLALRIDRLAELHSPRVIRLSERSGIARALNAGLREIETEWVARSDADDYSLPDRFALQTAAMTAEVDIVGGAIREVDETGAVTGLRAPPLDHAAILRYARTRNPFNHMTVAFRRDLAAACGFYPLLPHAEDYGLWAAMLSRGAHCRNLPDIVVEASAGMAMYRRRGGWDKLSAEILLQRHLVRHGLKTPPAGVALGLGRAAFSLAPARLRGWIYEKFLRTQ